MLGILLYEDNDGLRESLVNLLALSRDFLLLGHFARATGVVKQVEELKPDVILMDIDMPGVNGIEAVKRVRTVDKRVQIIMLTIFDDNRHVLDAICAGASGYLLKKHLSDHLPNAIRQVMHGESPMSPGIARMIIQSMQEQAAKPATRAAADYGLTNREKEILAQLSKGKALKMIAGDLSISLDTVRTHIKNIYEKLQVHSQAEAVSKALNDGLV
ncbi:MAG TPA: response regulator transcription factor [Puia sp.]|jgi:DNA-binding NarL/FixJ family response regulator|nr:response regulator transcription factor [Puia sp.]